MSIRGRGSCVVEFIYELEVRGLDDCVWRQIYQNYYFGPSHVHVEFLFIHSREYLLSNTPK